MSIDTIYSAGDDFIGYMFDIVVPPLPGFSDSELFKLRVTTHTTPSSTVGGYDITRKGLKITKPNGVDDSEKTFTISFRADKNLALYSALVAWKNLIVDEQTGISSSDSVISNQRRDITCLFIGKDGIPLNKGLVYRGCYPSVINGISLDMAATDASSIDITFTFLAKTPLEQNS